MSYLASLVRPAATTDAISRAAAAGAEPVREEHSEVEVASPPALEAPIDRPVAAPMSPPREAPATPAPDRPQSMEGERERPSAPTGTPAARPSATALQVTIEPSPSPSRLTAASVGAVVEAPPHVPVPASPNPVVPRQVTNREAPLSQSPSVSSAPSPRGSASNLDTAVPPDVAQAHRPLESVRPATVARVTTRIVPSSAPTEPAAHGVGTAPRRDDGPVQVHIGAITLTVKAAPAPPSRAAPAPSVVAPVAMPAPVAQAARAREGFGFSASRHYLRWS